MDEEPRYTLSEADMIRRLDECSRHGHDWNIVASIGDGPYAITCGTCGWSGSVTMGEAPKRPGVS